MRGLHTAVGQVRRHNEPAGSFATPVLVVVRKLKVFEDIKFEVIDLTDVLACVRRTVPLSMMEHKTKTPATSPFFLRHVEDRGGRDTGITLLPAHHWLRPAGVGGGEGPETRSSRAGGELRTSLLHGDAGGLGARPRCDGMRVAGGGGAGVVGAGVRPEARRGGGEEPVERGAHLCTATVQRAENVCLDHGKGGGGQAVVTPSSPVNLNHCLIVTCLPKAANQVGVALGALQPWLLVAFVASQPHQLHLALPAQGALLEQHKQGITLAAAAAVPFCIQLPLRAAAWGKTPLGGTSLRIFSGPAHQGCHSDGRGNRLNRKQFLGVECVVRSSGGNWRDSPQLPVHSPSFLLPGAAPVVAACIPSPLLSGQLLPGCTCTSCFACSLKMASRSPRVGFQVQRATRF